VELGLAAARVSKDRLLATSQVEFDEAVLLRCQAPASAASQPPEGLHHRLRVPRAAGTGSAPTTCIEPGVSMTRVSDVTAAG
jgi:hypothetical protein